MICILPHRISRLALCCLATRLMSRIIRAAFHVPRRPSAAAGCRVMSETFAGGVQAMSHSVRALKKLHSTGYAHRDIKPGNILRRPKQHDWTLIDFGCAAQIGATPGGGISSSPEFPPPRSQADESHLSFLNGMHCSSSDDVVYLPITPSAVCNRSRRMEVPLQKQSCPGWFMRNSDKSSCTQYMRYASMIQHRSPEQ